MPKAVAVMVSLMDDPDARTRAAAAGYILDRVLGKAAPATKPPAEDNEAPPVTESDARVMVRSLLQGVTPDTASRVQEILVADLRAQGRIVVGDPDPA